MIALDALTALRLTEILIALAVMQQTLELLYLRPCFGNGGIWDWQVIRDEMKVFPQPIQYVLDFALENTRFSYVLVARLLAALALLLSPFWPLSIFLFFTQLGICLRWRGVFNGGSDYMTVTILLALSVAGVFRDSSFLVLACLTYIGIQVLASYFIAGIVKIREPRWRSGIALKRFLGQTLYYTNEPSMRWWTTQKNLQIAGLFVISLELLSPLALLSPLFCLTLLALMFLFHLGNAWIFGLNRFVMAWLAGYPALYFCSTYF